MEYHRSRVLQMIPMSRELSRDFLDTGMEQKLEERAQRLQQLINDVKASDDRLGSCVDHCQRFHYSIDQVEHWLDETQRKLDELFSRAESRDLVQEECMQFWVNFYKFEYFFFCLKRKIFTWQVLKAESDDKQQQWKQSQSHLDRAVTLIPIDQEDAYRQRCIAVERLWVDVNRRLQQVESALVRQSQQSNVPLEDRIACIECSLARIESALIHSNSSCSTEDEAEARRQELQASCQVKGRRRDVL